MKKILPLLLIAAFAFAKTAVPAQPPLRSAEILVHDINAKSVHTYFQLRSGPAVVCFQLPMQGRFQVLNSLYWSTW